MSPARRRDAIETAQEMLRVSQRLACRAVGQPRSTQRYRYNGDDHREEQLVARIRALAKEHPRYGYRRIGKLLNDEGWHVNHKRTYRLWRRERLHLPRISKPRRRTKSDVATDPMVPADESRIVWAWDVIIDQTTSGHKLSWLSILDESTRVCLVLEVHRGISAKIAEEALKQALDVHEAPSCLRSDNSRHLTAQSIRKWLEQRSIELLVSQPGAPWENAHVEAFHGRMRDEFLNVHTFGSLEEARRLTERWQYHYNHRRAHSILGYMTPYEFAQRYWKRKMDPDK